MNGTVHTHRLRRFTLPAWCLLLMLAWALWLWQLDFSSLTFDEVATVRVAHRPLPEILTYLRQAVREHPPVYYVLIHLWMEAAGTGEFSLRFFSVATGLIGLSLAGWVARRMEQRALGGLIPALLLAMTPGMAYFVRDARMYSLGIIWTLLSAGLFLRDWFPAAGWPRRRALAGLLMVHFLALFTHYYLLLPILVQPLVLLLTRRWRALLAWCALHCLPALTSVAWVLLSPGLKLTAGSLLPHLNLALPPCSQVMRLVGKTLFSEPVSVRYGVLYSLMALAAGGMLLTLWRRRGIGLWLALVTVAPITLAYLIPHPPEPRYVAFLVPSLVLSLSSLATAPLRLARSRWVAWSGSLALSVATGGLLVAGGVFDAITFERSNYERILRTVRAHARPGDGLLFYGPWQRIQFDYYDPGGMPPITWIPFHAPPQLNPDQARPVLETLTAQYDRLWVLPAAVDEIDPAHYAEGWLRTHAHRVWDTPYLSLYLPPLPTAAPTQTVGIDFGQELRLESIAWEPEPVLEGDSLRLTLNWRPGRALEDDVVLTLRLVDGYGHPWVQVHTIPGQYAQPASQWEPGDVFVDYQGMMVPWGAPPGEYTLYLSVTEKDSGTPLQADGLEQVPLLIVTVGAPPAPTDTAEQPIETPYRLFLPLVTRGGSRRGPILHGLPNLGAATFCSPDRTTCLALAGYEPGTARAQQGNAVPLTLHWLAPERPLPEMRARLRVVHRPWFSPLGDGETTIVTQTLDLVPGYPAPLWPPGRLVTQPCALKLPPDGPTGRTEITLEVLGPDGRPWSAVGPRNPAPTFVSPLRTGGGLRPTGREDTIVSLFPIAVDPRPVLRRLPGRLTPVTVDFGQEVGLRGYRVSGDPRPGGQIEVTYAWYARTQPEIVYAVFNHLVAADGSQVAQVDGWPQEGRMLSIQWQPGEYVEDRYTLTIPPDAPPGPYTLYVGLYNAANGERQPVRDEGGRRLPEDQWAIPLPGEGQE